MNDRVASDRVLESVRAQTGEQPRRRAASCEAAESGGKAEFQSRSATAWRGWNAVKARIRASTLVLFNFLLLVAPSDRERSSI